MTGLKLKAAARLPCRVGEKLGANAMDVTALFTGPDAAKAGVTEGTNKLLAAIDKVQGKAPQ